MDFSDRPAAFAPAVVKRGRSPRSARRAIMWSASPSPYSIYIVKRNRTFGGTLFRREGQHLMASAADVLQITEGRICFWLNQTVSRHRSVGMRQAQAPLATMENSSCSVCCQVLREVSSEVS